MRRIRRVHVLVAALTAALCVPASGVSSAAGGPTTITKVGKNESALNLIAWEGYTQPQWVKPFTKATGCKVRAKYGGSSDEMVTLMRTGQYDAVSASGDASLRLIVGKDVRAVDPNLIPDFKNFIPALKSPPHNTVKGVHYGISLQWGPNTLLYNTQKVKAEEAPQDWDDVLAPRYAGRNGDNSFSASKVGVALFREITGGAYVFGQLTTALVEPTGGGEPSTSVDIDNLLLSVVPPGA